MKIYITLSLFMSFYLAAFNQTINGVVLDKSTNEKIEFATIYFNGTLVGTSSDLEGNFELDISGFTSKPLTISAIGYYSKTITDLADGDQLTIRLKPKVYSIHEAVVSSKSLVRQRRINLNIFKEEFLGSTDNSWDCKIVNENDISFNYFEDDDTLKAFASKPIRIKNEALAYNITYFLDLFEYYKETKFVYFMGNFIFEEDSSLKDERVLKNREYAYYGSRMHFLRSLWADKLKSNGFSIVDSKYKKIKYEDIVVQDEHNNKFIKYKGKLIVYYHSIESKMILSAGLVSFEEDGNFDPSGIKWEGLMASKRIADWLPLNFSIDK